MNAQLAEKMCRGNFVLRNCGKIAPASLLKTIPILSSLKTTGLLSGKCPSCQESYYKKEVRYVGYIFPYSFSSFTWAVICWTLAESAAPNHVHLVSSVRRKEVGAEPPWEEKPFWSSQLCWDHVFSQMLSQDQHLLSLISPGGLCSQDPCEEILGPSVVWNEALCGMFDCAIVFHCESKKLNLHPCVVPMPVFIKSLSHLP